MLVMLLSASDLLFDNSAAGDGRRLLG